MQFPEYSTAMLDWQDRLKAGDSIIPAPIFEETAEHALTIFKQLRVTDIPGKPTFGECSEEWVFDFVRAIFGAYHEDSGKQLIREYFMLVSKKNSKSTAAAGIMVTALILCWRENEELLILSPTKEVSENSFKPAAAMIREDDDLKQMFQVQDHLKTITHRVNRNSLKVVAADTDTVSGKKSGRVLVDELWIFGKRTNADAMLMEALGGQISRDEGWVIYLTTQSDEPPAGVFKDKLEYFRDVRDGKIKDNKSLPVIYEFPDDMVKSKSYMEPSNFHIANPNMGRSVSKEWLQDNLIKNQNKTDGSFQQFIAKHLNVQIGMNLRNDRWPGADFWESCGDSRVTLDYLLSNSEVVDIGIDGGGLDDLLGMSVVGRHSETKKWLIWNHAWAHPSVFERRKDIAARLNDFIQDGDLTRVDRIGDDVAGVAMICSQVYAANLLDLIGLDPVGIGSILDALEEAEIPSESIVSVSQGWKLSGAIKTTERKLAEGVILHQGSAMMSWCASNARVVPVGNAINITKQVSGSSKIDPLMATFNAIDLMSRNPESKKKDYQMFFV